MPTMNSPLAAVVSDLPARDTRAALLRLMREEGIVAIRLLEVSDADKRRMIEAEALRQMGGRS
jgi:hypothetical protein